MSALHMPSWRELLLRTVIFLPGLLWLSQSWGSDYVNLLLPLYRAVISRVLPHCKVVTISEIQQGGEWMVAVQLVTRANWILASQAVPAGVSMTITTLSGHALKPIVIVVAAALIWPALDLRERVLRLLLSVPIIALLEIINIPPVLAGAAQNLLLTNLVPHWTGSTFCIGWMHWLDGGGRLMLPLFAAGSLAVLRADLTTAAKTVPRLPISNPFTPTDYDDPQ